MIHRILLIRFSSFGDVTQCLSVPSALVAKFPGAEVHWVVRSEFAGLLQNHPHIHTVHAFDRKKGLGGLVELGRALRAQKFDLIYDAHTNLRSRVLSAVIRAPWIGAPKLVRRSLRRTRRFLLFKFRLRLFRQPFSGQRDLLAPLRKLGVSEQAPPAPQMFFSENERAQAEQLTQNLPARWIACAPSAAHALKRWPISYWQDTIRALPDHHFVLLGGKEDIFLEDIAAVAPERVLNLAGRSSLRVSAAVVDRSALLLTNDTGLLHVAEQRGRPALALMGPAPFGFPSRPTTRVMEIDLACRPCSKHGQGPCYNEVHQRCMVDIRPAHVVEEIRRMWAP